MKDSNLKQYKKSANNDNLVRYGYMRVKVNGASDANPLTYVAVNTAEAYPYVDANIYIIGDAVFADNNQKVHASPLENNTPAGTYGLELSKYTTISLRAGSTRKNFIEFNIDNLKFNEVLKNIEIPSDSVYGELSSITSRKMSVLALPYTKITGTINDIMNAFDNSTNLGAGKTAYIDLDLFSTTVSGNLKSLLDHIAAIASSGNRFRYNVENSQISTEGLSPSGTGIQHTVTFDGQGGYSIV